jgi:hypothetical protein
MPENGNGQRHDRTALILYGSETGNSQDVAEDLGRVVERLHFLTRVCEMDSIEIVCPFLISHVYASSLLICHRIYSLNTQLLSSLSQLPDKASFLRMRGSCGRVS